jgi:hypothetical protein
VAALLQLKISPRCTVSNKAYELHDVALAALRFMRVDLPKCDYTIRDAQRHAWPELCGPFGMHSGARTVAWTHVAMRSCGLINPRIWEILVMMVRGFR